MIYLTGHGNLKTSGFQHLIVHSFVNRKIVLNWGKIFWKAYLWLRGSTQLNTKKIRENPFNPRHGVL